MNLNRIRYFIVVAEELHFGRAAQRLNVVQPALSQQIKLLERDLGMHLLERSSRRVALTEAGNAYLVEARHVIQQVEIAAQAARDAVSGYTGVLHVGFVDNAIWASLPRIIRDFRGRYPKVELALSQRPRGPQLAMLENSDLDVAIVPGPVLRPGIANIELERSPLYVALAQGHPLAERSGIHVEALASEPFIAVPAPNDPRRINEVVYQLCANAGFQPIFGQSVEQMHTSLSLVSAGLGIAAVPRWICPAWTDNIVYRPLLPVTDYVLIACYRAARTGLILKAFLDSASQIAAPKGPAID